MHIRLVYIAMWVRGEWEGVDVWVWSVIVIGVFVCVCVCDRCVCVVFYVLLTKVYLHLYLRIVYACVTLTYLHMEENESGCIRQSRFWYTWTSESCTSWFDQPVPIFGDIWLQNRFVSKPPRDDDNFNSYSPVNVYRTSPSPANQNDLFPFQKT